MTDKNNETEIKEEILNEEISKENQEVEEKGNEATENIKTENVENVSPEMEIEKLKNEIKELNSSYLRKHAEFQNFAKRKEKEYEDLKAYSSEKIMIKLLGIIDNLERAIISSSESKDFDSLVKGVELTLTQMNSIAAAEGVEAIVISEKTMYDPHHHQAVGVESSDEHENDEIIAEFQKGYKMKSKVIRPSMVKVCKK